MTHLQEEAAAYRRAMQEREAAYAAREKEYVAKIQSLRDAAEKGEGGAEGPGPAAEATEAAEREAKEASAAARARRGAGESTDAPETTAAAGHAAAKAAAARGRGPEDSPLSGASRTVQGGASCRASKDAVAAVAVDDRRGAGRDGGTVGHHREPPGELAGISASATSWRPREKTSGSGEQGGKGRGKGNQR